MDAHQRPGGKSWRSTAVAPHDVRGHEPLESHDERLASRAEEPKNGSSEKGPPVVLSRRRRKTTDAQKHQLWTRLLEADVGKIVQTARQLRGRGVPFSDLVQEGALALLTAIERVENQEAMELDEYAAVVVQQHLENLVGAEHETAATSGGLLEHALAPDPQVLRLETEKIEKAHALLALLGRDEERVLRMRFGIDVNERPTLEETAQSLGMKRGRVSSLESKALILLRRAARRLRWTFPR